MKIILTGATGFIGQALLSVLNDQNIFVYVIVRNYNCYIFEKYSNIRMIECAMEDYSNLPDLIEDEIDICIHLAWEGSTGDARSDYEMQLSNCYATMNLIHSLAKMNVRRFVGVGTIAEMDVLNYHMNSGAMPNAVSFYGIEKLNCHLMSKTECTRYGIEHVWCRMSNIYGEKNTTGNFVSMACKKFISGERATFTDGMQYYDFVYIDDAVNAIYSLARNGRTNTCYYVGSGEPKRLRDFILKIRDVISPDADVFLGEIPFKGKSLKLEDFSIEPMIRDTGFCPRISFENGIVRVSKYLRNMKT